MIRTEFGRFGRQISGYSLEHLLPERRCRLGPRLRRHRGHVGVITAATVDLVARPGRGRTGRPRLPRQTAAAEDTGSCSRTTRSRWRAWMPAWSRWCVVAAATPPCPSCPRAAAGCSPKPPATPRADAIDAARRSSSPTPIASTRRRRRTGRPRFCGGSARTAPVWVAAPGRHPAWPGWEDAAVPPDQLGRLPPRVPSSHGPAPPRRAVYGHFGDGCVHARIDFPLADHAERYRVFVTEAARLVARHGGSLSGEHGDGRARGELLPIMYSPAAIATFAAVKHLSTPEPAQSRRPGRPRAARRRRCGCRPRARCGNGLGFSYPTTMTTSPSPCTAASASASAAPTTPRPAG